MKELKQLDLFPSHPDAKFVSKSPINKERLSAQNKAIFEYLSTGGTLTSLKALKRLGVLRLASRMHELRKEATIYDRFIDEGGVRVKEYSLKPFPETK
jgi:hypothetical protein